MLDIFRSDAFGMVSLTTAINKLPYKPSRIGEMGIFNEKGIPTTSVAMEERQGKLSLVAAKARGSMPQVQESVKRVAKMIPCLALPENDTVMADEVQNIRAFGTEDSAAGVAQVVNDKLQRLRQNMEATHEYQRLGAVLGKTYDADGSTVLFDWFSEFGLTQYNIDMDFSSATLQISDKCLAVIQLVEDALGAQTYTRLRAICGNAFFGNLIAHADVKDAFKAWQIGSGFNQSQVFTLNSPQVKREGFEYGGIIWENYRGYVGSSPFMPTDEARVFPEGVPDLFQGAFAPAPFMETVNTVGKPVYVKQERMKFDVGVELHVSSYPLFWCSRPQVCVKLTRTGNVTGLYTRPSGPLQ
jgi:hypothetical protein